MIEAVRDTWAGANSSGKAPTGRQDQAVRARRRPIHRLLLESTALVGFTITAAAAFPAVALITGLTTTQASAQVGGTGGTAAGGGAGGIGGPSNDNINGTPGNAGVTGAVGGGGGGGGGAGFPNGGNGGDGAADAAA